MSGWCLGCPKAPSQDSWSLPGFFPNVWVDTADEDAWLYHKSKPEVDVDSLLQATLLPSPVEDEVDTNEALALAGRVSELSTAATPEHSDFVLS